MNGIVIYMEGGGSGKGASNAKRSLRVGMDQFLVELKNAARSRGLRWKLVCCGSRDKAFNDFRNFREHDGYDKSVLLVDAEELMQHNSAREHLQARDNWNLNFCSDDSVHLMTQVMETWILADIESLAEYYKVGFEKSALPNRTNLEQISKQEIARALKLATQNTSKGEYQKIKHASQLLMQLNANRVRRHCSCCETLFQTLQRIIEVV